MRKFTLLIASLFLSIGAMAQTPVLELTAEQIGTAYPYALSDEDAAKIFALGDVTIEFDVTMPASLGGRKALLVAADPEQQLTSVAVKTNSPYYGFGINGSDAGYFASSKDGDRFTGGANEGALSGNKRCIITYVVDNTNKVITVVADGKMMYSCVYPVIEYEMPNFKNVKSRYPNAKIYIGGGVTSNGNIDTFNGTVNSVKVYEGARANTYFRFKAVDTNNQSTYYLVADETKITVGSAEEKGAESIFYYNNNTLSSYYAGKNITYGNHTNVGGAATKAIIHSSNSKNPYKIWVAGKYIESNQSQSNGIGYYTRNLNTNLPGTSGSNWTVEAVTALPVTIGEAGYATFYAPVAVRLPEGVTAHTVVVDGDAAKLSDAITEVPANTGVILRGEGDVELTIIGSAAAVGENHLVGNILDTAISGYVLANGANGVGFYATEDNFVSKANKAYLPATAMSSAAFYGFLFEGTTGVENVVVESAPDSVYDLTGRRIDAINAAGIYIVNGKKVLVK